MKILFFSVSLYILLISFHSIADFKSEVESFVSVLGQIGQNMENNGGYRPDLLPWILIDRDDQTKFAAINLNVLSGCNSNSIVQTTSICMGTSSVHLPIPGNGNPNYDFLDRNNLPEEPLRSFFDWNPQTKVIVYSAQPWVLPPEEIHLPPDFMNSTLLHEGFHTFIQLGTFRGLDSIWRWDTEDFRHFPREAIHPCLDPTSPFISREYEALATLLTSLELDESISSLKKRFLAWEELRESRYASIPSIIDPRVGKVDCRGLDTYYERLEGTADFVSFSALLDAGRIQMHDLVNFYREIILDHPEQSHYDDYAIYAAGFAYGSLLDRLSVSKNWREELAGNEKSSMRKLVSDAFKQL